MGVTKTPRNIGTIVAFILAIIIVIACVCGLIMVIHTTITINRSFANAHSDALERVANLQPDERELTQLSIDHLERLQQLQRDSSNTGFLSIIYGFISTGLVGVGATLVYKIYAKFEKSKKSIDEAIDTASKAVDKARHIEEYYLTSERLYEGIHLQIRNHEAVIKVMPIHIDIVNAKDALTLHNQIEANDRIREVCDMIGTLTLDIDKNVIHRLRQEVLKLHTRVDHFREYAEKHPDETYKKSILQATDIYDAFLERAKNHCDMLIEHSNKHVLIKTTNT